MATSCHGLWAHLWACLKPWWAEPLHTSVLCFYTQGLCLALQVYWEGVPKHVRDLTLPTPSGWFSTSEGESQWISLSASPSFSGTTLKCALQSLWKDSQQDWAHLPIAITCISITHVLMHPLLFFPLSFSFTSLWLPWVTYQINYQHPPILYYRFCFWRIKLQAEHATFHCLPRLARKTTLWEYALHVHSSWQMMDGWMIRWRNRCKDGWIDPQMDEWTNKSMLLGTTEKI